MVYSTSQLEPAMGDALLGTQWLPQRGWTDFETAKDVVEAVQKALLQPDRTETIFKELDAKLNKKLNDL